jgi:hypothetical protein
MKRRTSLYIENDILEKAKQKKINISRFLEEKLREVLDEKSSEVNKVDKLNENNFELQSFTRTDYKANGGIYWLRTPRPGFNSRPEHILNGAYFIPRFSAYFHF